jgi:hypothetical protein
MSDIQDERTTAVAQRWGARGMMIFSFALTIDVLVRILILKQPPQQWWDISLIWITTTLYVGIGMTATGVAPYGGKWSKSWLVIVIIVVTNTVVIALMGMIHSLAELITIIVTGAAGAFISIIILRGISSLWERRALGRSPREE